MTDYQLTATEEPCSVIRSDGSLHPARHGQPRLQRRCVQSGYIQWKEAGNT